MQLNLHWMIDTIYKPHGFSCDNIVFDKESSDYGAATFLLNNNRVLFRVSKITPTKTGQFVTLWKRINGGPIQPFDAADPVDTVIIAIRAGDSVGQFVFPKEVMVKKNIFSKNNTGGKRAIRVYAPWDKANSPQALKTKSWQNDFFKEISNEKK